MSVDNLHRQCRLKRGSEEQVTWIEMKYAREGHVVKLKKPDGTWDDGWVVESVGTIMDSERVAENERRNRKKPPSLENA